MHTLAGLLEAAAREPSSFMSFLYAAVTDSAKLPDEPTTQERRKLLCAYTAFHIILNVAHRRHTTPLQRFVSRVVETSGASYNTRKLLTMMRVSLDPSLPAEWNSFGSTGSDESLKVCANPPQ